MEGFLIFIEVFLFFLLVANLFLWWTSRSSSFSLLMVLVLSIFSVMGNSFFIEMKIPLFMVVLALSGGLFVLISFVIMFFPSDFKGMVFFFNWYCFWLFILVSLGVVIFSNKGGVFFWGIDGSYGSVKVWGNFFFIYIFLIVILFLFLFLVNSIVNPSTGSMFSNKKLKGKMMG